MYQEKLSNEPKLMTEFESVIEAYDSQLNIMGDLLNDIKSKCNLIHQWDEPRKEVVESKEISTVEERQLLKTLRLSNSRFIEFNSKLANIKKHLEIIA